MINLHSIYFLLYSLFSEDQKSKEKEYGITLTLTGLEKERKKGTLNGSEEISF